MSLPYGSLVEEPSVMKHFNITYTWNKKFNYPFSATTKDQAKRLFEELFPDCPVISVEEDK